MIEINEIWNEVDAMFRLELQTLAYNTWISRLKPVSYDGEEFIIYSPNEFTKKMVNQKYSDDIQNYIEILLGTKPRIVIVDPSSDEITKENTYPVDKPVDRTENILTREFVDVESPAIKEETQSIEIVDKPKENQIAESMTKLEILSDNKPIKNYTFENFVAGKSNEFALSAARAVANAPAQEFNPLFIYGSAGLGKTHLMYAIARHILEHFPEKSVVYLTSETFTNDLIQSIHTNKNKEFRQKYREVDVLIIDDIQFIAGKAGTQEEFFHTFNDLYNNNKQIIISSDRPPKEIKTLEERLISRFEWGLIADIQRPDFETRVAILNRKMELEEANVPKDVIEFIAINIKDNIRELEGALVNLLAYARIMQIEDINLSSCKDILENIIEEEERITIDIERIKDVVSNYYQITVDELDSKNRSTRIAFPRQIAMYLSREMTDLSLVKIAEDFNRDHSTIIHGINKISDQEKIDEDLKYDLEQLTKKIKS